MVDILCLFMTLLSSMYSTRSNIYKVVPTQRTCALVAALKPPEQADRVEGVLAGGASLVRRLHICRDDRITDGTLALSLESTLHVPAEGHQPIDQTSVGEHDHSLDREQPILPFLFVNKHPTATDHNRGMKRVCGRKRNGYRDRG